MTSEPGAAPDRDRSPLHVLVTGIGLLGGVMAFCLAGLVTTSVVMRWVLGMPVPGDFEFVQMGTALIVFSFLPLCQIQRANIIVDTFTQNLSQRACARLDALWDVVYGCVIALIGYAMIQGVIDAWRSGEETMVSRIQIWPALAISTALVLLLSIVAFYTAWRLIRSTR